MDNAFSILVVCTANECRSPMIEYLLARAARERGLTWHVASAGTGARPGAGLHPRAAQALRAHGIETDGWQGSRQLTAELLDTADLVLAAARSHRSTVVALRPRSLPLAFLFREFVRLRRAVPAVDAADPAALVSAAARARSRVAAPLADADDIADPVGRRQRTFDRLCREIADGVTSITAG